MSYSFGRHVAPFSICLIAGLFLLGVPSASAQAIGGIALSAVLQEDQPPAETPSEPEQPPADQPPAEQPKADPPVESAPQGEPEETPPNEDEKAAPDSAPPAEETKPEMQEEAPGEMPAERPTEPSSESPGERPAEEDKPEDDDSAPLPETIKVDKFVVLPKAGNYGRAAIQVDPVEAAIARGQWKTPGPGDSLESADGRTLRWRSGRVDASGVLTTTSIAGGGYAVAEVECPRDAIYVLRGTGHAAVYVNGRLHAGDVYALGGFDLPVELQKGKNELVFHVYQPQLKVELVKPESTVQLLTDRAVVPTPVVGMDDRVWIGLPVLNAGREALEGARLVARVEGGEAVETSLPWTGPATLYNASFEVAIPTAAANRTLPLEVSLMRGDEELASERIDLALVDQGEKQVRTFRSTIDGSVQSYAVRPASDKAPAGDLVSEEVSSAKAKAGLVALHGLGSTAEEFLEHYSAKSWAHVIAPSGRGRYGFDWEDWSRADAVQAIDDARQHFDLDPTRLYLSGHAAGGHGALVLAASQPERFAAITTAGAWSSLWSYGGGMPQYADPTPPQAMLLRCATPSAAEKLFANLRGTSLLVQHSADDKQVPLAEARVLMAGLAAVHDDYRFLERPGGGSWWGAETVDGKLALEFLASHKLESSDKRVIELATADLATVSSRDWVGIGAQASPFELSTLRAERKGDSTPSLEITTTNVERLFITKGAVPAKTVFTVRIDGSRPIRLSGMPASGEIWFARQGNNWTRVLSDKKLKGPHRSGGFKSVFGNDALLVYGTKGTPEETAWARAKARFDAESFYYRGGGSLEVIPDTQFRADADRDRNVVLYGNADSNGAWPALLSLSPVQVRREHIQVDLRPESDSALGVLMVRPRPGSDTAVVGVVGGTNVEGMKLTSRLRYFMAGVNYPDLMILGPRSLDHGDSDLRAAGFFATNWDIDDEDLAWRDLAL